MPQRTGAHHQSSSRPRRTAGWVAVHLIRGILSFLIVLCSAFQASGDTGQANLRVLFLGDSITLGEGDAGVPSRDIPSDLHAGFVSRFANLDKATLVSVFGVEGKSSLRIIEEIERQGKQKQGGKSLQLRDSLAQADVIILSAGLNDYWDQVSPHHTALRLRTVTERLRVFAPRATIYVATVPLPVEPFHRKWAQEFNDVLISRSLRNLAPGPRFHEIAVDLRAPDGLHPSPAGYDQMANLIVRFFCRTIESYRKTRPLLCEPFTPVNALSKESNIKNANANAPAAIPTPPDNRARDSDRQPPSGFP